MSERDPQCLSTQARPVSGALERRCRQVSRAGFAFLMPVIVIGSLVSMDMAEKASLGVNDKLQHVGVYGAAALFAALGFRLRLRLLVLLLALSVTLEMMQGWVTPDRAFDALDLAANAAGVGLGAIVALGVRRAWASRRPGRGAPQPQG